MVQCISLFFSMIVEHNVDPKTSYVHRIDVTCYRRGKLYVPGDQRDHSNNDLPGTSSPFLRLPILDIRYSSALATCFGKHSISPRRVGHQGDNRYRVSTVITDTSVKKGKSKLKVFSLTASWLNRKHSFTCALLSLLLLASVLHILISSDSWALSVSQM